MPLTVSLPAVPAAPPAADLRPQELANAVVSGIYVHVPFCFHKCHYCDFYSITRQDAQRMTRFVDLLLREADRWTSGAGPVPRPRTVFFGGGTPSLLPAEQMHRLISGLRDRFNFSGLDEWTVECNPATVDGEFCGMLAASGVNRLSFGAQSFDRGELKMLERHHEPDDVPRSLEIARAAGFRRLNLDLIYGIPGQEMGSWLASLDAALALGTQHLSCYGLTYEPNTPIAVKKRLGQVTAIEEDAELAMLHATRRRLADAGLRAYEISNYAVPGEECRHNLLYWNGGDYVGLGPSAASHVRGVRWRNRPHLGEWEAAVEHGQVPAIDLETLSPRRRAGELAMLRLRLADGVDYADFAAQTGYDAHALYGETIEHLRRIGLLNVDARGFRVSERGLNVADSIGAEFLV